MSVFFYTYNVFKQQNLSENITKSYLYIHRCVVFHLSMVDLPYATPLNKEFISRTYGYQFPIAPQIEWTFMPTPLTTLEFYWMKLMQVLCMLLQSVLVHMLNFAIVPGKSSLWLNTASGSLNHSDIEKQTNKTPSNKQNKTKQIWVGVKCHLNLIGRGREYGQSAIINK